MSALPDDSARPRLLLTQDEQALLTFLVERGHRGFSPVEIGLAVSQVREEQVATTLRRMVRYGLVNERGATTGFTTTHLPRLRWQATDLGKEALATLLQAPGTPVYGLVQQREVWNGTRRPAPTGTFATQLGDGARGKSDTDDHLWQDYAWLRQEKLERDRAKAVAQEEAELARVSWVPDENPGGVGKQPVSRLLLVRLGLALVYAYPRGAIVPSRSVGNLLGVSFPRATEGLRSLAREGAVTSLGSPQVEKGSDKALRPLGLVSDALFWQAHQGTEAALVAIYYLYHPNTPGAEARHGHAEQIERFLREAPAFESVKTSELLTQAGIDAHAVDPCLAEAHLFRMMPAFRGRFWPNGSAQNSRTVLWSLSRDS